MSNKYLILLLFFPILYQCSSKQQEREFIFSVPVQTAKVVKVSDPGEPPPPPPPPRQYYTRSNFIVDSLGNLYFFQFQTFTRTCGSDLDENTPPAFIDLRPAEIVAVPASGLEDFVKLNVLNYEPADRIVSIALMKDSIQSEGLFRLTNILKDSTNRAMWFIRESTQEESIVMAYKKRLARFYPDDIKWDSTKTRFPPNMNTTIFIPPAIVDSDD